MSTDADLTKAEYDEKRQAKRDIYEDRQTELANQIQAMTGAVRSMPVSDVHIPIGDGWKQRRLFESQEFDLWARTGPEGAELDPVCHPDHMLYLVVLTGEALLTVDGQGTLMGPENGAATIQQGQTYKMKARTDVHVLAIYRPPIGEEE